MRAAVAGLVLLIAACGSEPPDVRPDAGVAPSLIPLAEGNTWRYRVTSSGGTVTEKVQSVTGTAATSNPGEVAFRLLSERANARETSSVQLIRDGVLLRLEEEGYRAGVKVEHYKYLPGSIRIDSTRVKTGDTYESSHTKQRLDASGNVIGEVNVVHRFMVEATAEAVDVPAGRFACVRVRREAVDDGGVKTYWYAPGLGKVKEIGGQTEELMQYTVAP